MREVAFWLCAGAFLLAAIGIAITPTPQHDNESVAKARAVVEEDPTRGHEVI